MPINIPNASQKFVAGRRLMKASLVACLCLDMKISCLQIHEAKNIILVGAGPVIAVLALDTLKKIFVLGRSTGNKAGPLFCLAINASGRFCISASVNERVTLWNIHKKSSDAVIHIPSVTSLCFHTETGFFVGNDQGQILLYEWPREKSAATLIQKIHPHLAPLRQVLSAPRLNVFSAHNDGVIKVWSLDSGLVTTILPEPNWPEKELVADYKEAGYLDIPKAFEFSRATDSECHHCGSVLAFCISPNNSYLATASTDKTCKLWRIVSIWQSSMKAPCDEDYRIKLPDINCCFGGEMHVGNAYIPYGKDAQLWWTFEHESAVLCVRFCPDSDLLFTGSLDCTCRVWNIKKGGLIYQINTPSAVRDIQVHRNIASLICDQRILQISYTVAKEAEVISQLEKKTIVDDKTMAILTAAFAKHGSSVNFSADEIKAFLAHGTLRESALESLLASNPTIKREQLMENMQKFDVVAKEIMKAILSGEAHPLDILEGLSQKDFVNNNPEAQVETLYKILRGHSPQTMAQFAEKAGFRPYSATKEPFEAGLKERKPVLIADGRKEGREDVVNLQTFDSVQPRIEETIQTRVERTEFFWTLRAEDLKLKTASEVPGTVDPVPAARNMFHVPARPDSSKQYNESYSARLRRLYLRSPYKSDASLDADARFDEEVKAFLEKKKTPQSDSVQTPLSNQPIQEKQQQKNQKSQKKQKFQKKLKHKKPHSVIKTVSSRDGEITLTTQGYKEIQQNAQTDTVPTDEDNDDDFTDDEDEPVVEAEVRSSQRALIQKLIRKKIKRIARKKRLLGSIIDDDWIEAILRAFRKRRKRKIKFHHVLGMNITYKKQDENSMKPTDTIKIGHIYAQPMFFQKKQRKLDMARFIGRPLRVKKHYFLKTKIN